MGFLASLASMACDLAPWLLVGTLLATLCYAFIPTGSLQRHLTGAAAVPKAVLLGAPLPLCCCGVLPALKEIRRRHASDGAAVAFLISVPQTGPDSFLVTMAFLGWRFALVKLVAAVLIALIGGYMADIATYLRKAAAGKESYKTLDDDYAALNGAVAGASEGSSAGGGGGVHKAGMTVSEIMAYFVMLLREVYLEMIVGLVVSAIVVEYVSFSFLDSWSDYGAAAVAVLVSIPIFLCLNAVIVLAASLCNSGFPTSAAMSLILACPATNLGTILTCWKELGGVNTVIYLFAVLVGSWGFGVTLSDSFSISVGHSSGGGGDDLSSGDSDNGNPLWEQASAVLLAIVFAYFAAQDLWAYGNKLWRKCSGGKKKQHKKKKSKKMNNNANSANSNSSVDGIVDGMAQGSVPVTTKTQLQATTTTVDSSTALLRDTSQVQGVAVSTTAVATQDLENGGVTPAAPGGELRFVLAPASGETGGCGCCVKKELQAAVEAVSGVASAVVTLPGETGTNGGGDDADDEEEGRVKLLVRLTYSAVRSLVMPAVQAAAQAQLPQYEMHEVYKVHISEMCCGSCQAKVADLIDTYEDDLGVEDYSIDDTVLTVSGNIDVEAFLRVFERAKLKIDNREEMVSS